MGIIPSVTFGTADSIQAFQVKVRDKAGLTTDHVVVSTYLPGMGEDECESLVPILRKHFHEASVSFTTENEEGSADVFVPSGERERCSFLNAAAAVATVKRVCGWDESPVIRIHFWPSNETILLSPRYEDDSWIVDGY